MPFELMESRLQPPRIGGRSVVRTGLARSLNGSADAPIVIVGAGPGYGKTTLLAQWIEASESRTAAWVSATSEDNDPIVLLTYVATALDRASRVGEGVFEALASPGASIETKILPRLGRALTRMDVPFVLAIDDFHAITNPLCIDAIATLSEHLPAESQLVLSTRDPSALPLGRLRARALLLELGPQDLRMDGEEARALLAGEGVDAPDEEIDKLIWRTEGWPAGIYLAALSSKAEGSVPGGVGKLTGDDPFVVDFLRSEFLARLGPRERRFLTRTSSLELLSGPLCDAVLESAGSSQMLESLVHSNHFVVALDRDRGWYRCHHLVREMLVAEFARSEPDQVSFLLGRAAEWCAANGQEIAAIAYGQAAGDVDGVAAMMERSIQAVYQSGRSATVQQWLSWLDTHGDLERYPAVAVMGAMFHAANGRPTESDRFAESAKLGSYDGPLPDGSASVESWRALLRAFCCREGVEAMGIDAMLAVEATAPDSSWHPRAVILKGLWALLSGDAEQADDRFADAAEEARNAGAANMIPLALAERALIAIAREEWVRADTLAERAVWAARRSHLEDSAINGLVYAVAARTALRTSHSAAVQEMLQRAQERLPDLTYALAILAVQTRLQMAYIYLELADKGRAQTMLAEIDAILRRRPELGTLPGQVAALRSSISSATRDAAGVWALTAAELRVLPLLATHLTFNEIAKELNLSRNTVKSHAMAVYRKLDVTSRSAAVRRARHVGVI